MSKRSIKQHFFPRGKLELHEVLTGTLRRMHHINRFSSLPVIKPENVAAHSWQASFIGMLVCYDLKERAGLEIVKTSEVVERLIAHDISECMSGDIIRTYKHSTPEIAAACEQADHDNTLILTKEIGGRAGERLFYRWEDAKDDSLEGGVVRLADAMCVVGFCVDEFRMGNRSLDDALKQCYEELLRPLGTQHELLKPYIAQVFPNDLHTDAYRNPTRKWSQTWK